MYRFSRSDITASRSRHVRQISTTADQEASRQIDTTFKLLDKAGEIKLKDEYKDFTLLLGPTGSGKSTFIQWIAGDNQRLISKRKKGGSFLIEDIGNVRIGNLTALSKTSVPELIIDAKNNAAYYDCPGFSDTRGTSKDIAGAYFNKKLIDHATSTKMVFFVKHVALQPGLLRNSFMEFLEHVCEFVKNFDKYHDSIAIFATHVSKPNESDVEVIDGIAEFLEKDIKRVLECRLKRSDNDRCDEDEINHSWSPEFCERAIKFVNILLSKQDGHYDRIGIFRTPTEEGPLGNIKSMQEAKKPVEEILYKKIKFANKDKDDFGYTISAKSKIGVNALIESINQRVRANCKLIADQMLKHYHDLVDIMEAKIDSSGRLGSDVGAKKSDAISFKHKFDTGLNAIKTLVGNIKDKNADELAAVIKSAIGNSGLEGYETHIKSIEKQGEFFKFFNTVGDGHSTSESWETILDPIITYLSESQRHLLHRIDIAAKNIKTKTKSYIEFVAKSIESQYEDKIGSLDLQDLSPSLSEGFKIMSEFQDSIRNISSVQRLSNELQGGLSKFGINSHETQSSLSALFNAGENLDFLKVMNNQLDERLDSNSLNRFKGTEKYLNDSKIFYGFLLELYRKLSSSDQQRDRNLHNVADIKDWGKVNSPQGIKIDRKNYKEFIDKLREESFISIPGTLYTIELKESHLSSLNQVLSTTLRDQLNIFCEPMNGLEQSLVIRGNYVKFSDFVRDSDNGIDLKSFKSCDHREVTAMSIFASKYLFIDHDFDATGKNLRLSVISPTWEIIGTRKIKLSGKDGDLHEQAQAGVNEMGKPGKPGGSSGSFMGMSEKILGDARLHIEVNGGRGGPGQDGGKGLDTISNGENPSQDPEYYHRKLWCPREGQSIRDEDIGFKTDTENMRNVEKESYMWFHGKKAKKSGDGRDGGRGGIGGKHGNVDIISDEGKSLVHRIKQDGSPGPPGLGGPSGEPKMDGNNVKMKCSVWDSFTNFFKGKGDRWFFEGVVFNGMGERGSNGQAGANELDMRDPEDPNEISRIPDIVNEFKKYSWASLSVGSNFVDKESLMKFLNYLDNLDQVRQSYDVIGFAGELNALESQSRKLNRRTLINYYESLRNRLTKYAKMPKSEDDTDEARKTLNYLLTSILSKLSYLNANSDSNLIIDVGSYLDLVKKDMDLVSNLRENSSRQEQIAIQQDFYKHSISRKIREANTFITDTLQPALSESYKNINTNIQKLIKEIKELEMKESKNLDDLRDKKGELQRNLTLRPLFVSLDILSIGLSFMGPRAAVLGGMVGIGNSVGQGSLTGNVDVPAHLKSEIAFQASRFNTMKNIELEKFDSEINEINKELADDKEYFKDTQVKVDKIKKELATNPSLERGVELKKELKQALEAKKLNAEQDKTNTKINYNKNDHRTQLASRSLMILSVGVDTMNKFKKDGEALKGIDQDIDNSKRKIESFKESVQIIDNYMIPMVENMMKKTNNVASNLEDRSKASLDITNWKAQDMLKKLKLELSKPTAKFEIHADLVYSVEMVQDVMSTLINIYDRIQSYQEQKNLAGYIAKLSGPCVGNGKMCGLQKDLDASIRSNFVLTQFKIAHGNLKQWVFPFAKRYIEELAVSDHMKSSTDNMETLVSEAKRKLDVMRANVMKYKSSLTSHDQYLHHKRFSSDFASSKPFFKWTNNSFREQIQGLLAGEKVALNADITMSDPDKDAIKFNWIEVNLKATSKDLQTNLNEKLANFKVSATHLGNSHYRCDDKYYVITSEKQNIEHSFEKNNGLPLDNNAVYSKMRSGDLVLSPYTMWELKLINITDKVSFDELRVFKDKIDLELVGEGSYVEGDKIKELEVEDYYEPDDSIGIAKTKQLAPTPQPAIVSQDVGRNNTKVRNKRSVRLIHKTSEQRPQSNHFDADVKQYLPIDTFEPVAKLLGDSSETYSMPNVVQSYDQWLNNNTVNSFLTLTNFLVRKMTGHKEVASKEDDDANSHLNLRMQERACRLMADELVDLVVDRINTHLRSVGFGPLNYTIDNDTRGKVSNEVYEKLLRPSEKSIREMVFGAQTVKDVLINGLLGESLFKNTQSNESNVRKFNKFLEKIQQDLPSIEQKISMNPKTRTCLLGNASDQSKRPSASYSHLHSNLLAGSTNDTQFGRIDHHGARMIS